MKQHANPTVQNVSDAGATRQSRPSADLLQYVRDERPETKARKSRLAAAENGPRAIQLKTLQKLADQGINLKAGKYPEPHHAVKESMGSRHAQLENETENIPGSPANDTVIQLAWEPDPEADPPGSRFKWDVIFEGKQWFYLPHTDKYYFIIDKKENLNFDAHDSNVFELDKDELGDEYNETLFGEIQKLEKEPLAHGFYFSDNDCMTIIKFDPLSLLVDETNPTIIHCLEYLIDDQYDSYLEAIKHELGGGEINGGVATVKLGQTFKSQLEAAHYKKEENKFGFGQAQYVKIADRYKATPLAKKDNKIQDALNKAIWAAIGLETEGLVETSTLNAEKNVLSQKNKFQVENITVYFTKRVLEAEVVEAGRQTVLEFLKIIKSITPDILFKVIGAEMNADFAAALNAKDQSIGQKVHPETKDIATTISKSVSEDQLRAYCSAVYIRWNEFLKKGIVIVFDKANFKEVFGKTPTIKGATPENLINTKTGAAAGLPEKPSALINLDSPDNLITLAHELAHTIGFNPTDCEASGHFTDSKRYLEAEAKYGPKLLFDAYYFETVFKKLKL